MTRIAYFFRRATSNMSGDFWANAGTVLVIALSLSIPGAFLLAWANAAKFAQTWVGQGQVVAYVKDNAPQDQVESLRRRLLSDPRIRSCSFVSKDEALQRFKQGPKEIAELIDGLSENPLPASIEIFAKPGHQVESELQKLANELAKEPIVTDTDFGQAWTDTFKTITNLLAGIGTFAAIFLMSAGIFISSNTIRLTIARRRDEIEIARLIGATTGFISAPFLIEGLILGTAGGAGALSILSLGFYIISTKLAVSATAFAVLLGHFQAGFMPHLMTPATLAAGAALGLVGSLLSVSRYIRI